MAFDPHEKAAALEAVIGHAKRMESLVRLYIQLTELGARGEFEIDLTPEQQQRAKDKYVAMQATLVTLANAT